MWDNRKKNNSVSEIHQNWKTCTLTEFCNITTTFSMFMQLKIHIFTYDRWCVTMERLRPLGSTCISLFSDIMIHLKVSHLQRTEIASHSSEACNGLHHLLSIFCLVRSFPCALCERGYYLNCMLHFTQQKVDKWLLIWQRSDKTQTHFHKCSDISFGF